MKASYMAIYMQNRRKRRREEALEFLGGCCVVCQTTENLEFDHIDPTTKIDTISSPKLLDGPDLLFINEVMKCQLLCREHHLEKTLANGDITRNPRTYPEPFHGGGAMYGLGCRCEQCAEWKYLYRRKKVNYSGILL